MKPEVDFAALAEEAASPATPLARLRELAHQFDYWSEHAPNAPHVAVREALACNPNTPVDQLESLAAQHPDAFLQNPMAPLIALEAPDFLDSFSAEQLLALLARAEAPALLIAPLASHAHARVREAARLHVNLADAELLDWKAEARRAYWRLFVTPAAALVELAELGLTPFRMVELLAGRWDQSLATRLLTANGDPECRALLELFQRAETTRHAGTSSGLTEVELSRLARGGPRARCLAAMHPGTPPALLADLARDASASVYRRVARNPALPPPLAAELVTHPDWQVRVGLARNPTLPPELLDRLAGDQVPPVRAAVARHPSTPAAALERLSQDARVSIRVAVARNPATPARLLVELAQVPRRSLQLGVLANPAAPPEARDSLQHVTPRQRGERFPWLAGAWKRRKPKRPRTARQQPAPSPPASPSPEPGEAEGTLPVLSPEELLEHYLDYDTVERRKRLAFDPRQPPETLEILARHRLPAVRAALAENPGVPAELLSRLAADPYTFVLDRVAVHPRTPLPALVQILPRVARNVARTLLGRAKPPQEVLEALSQHKDEGVRLEVARRSGLPERAVERLCGDRCRSVRQMAAGRSRAASYQEQRVRAALRDAAGGKDSLSRVLALAHPKTEPEVLALALRSLNWPDRLAVSVNPAAPPDLLEKLAGDANQVVQAAARARLGGEPPLVLDRFRGEEEAGTPLRREFRYDGDAIEGEAATR